MKENSLKIQSASSFYRLNKFNLAVDQITEVDCMKAEITWQEQEKTFVE